jgi:hypothetical protein
MRPGATSSSGISFDMQTQRDLTAERLEKRQRVAFSELPLADAIKTVRGKGERVLAVFSDPDCPYCRAARKRTREARQRHALHLRLSAGRPAPRGQGQGGVGLVRARSRACLGRVDEIGKAPPSASAITRSNATSQLGQRLGIQGTPTLLSADGRMLPGAATQASASSSGWRRAGDERAGRCVPLAARAGRLCRHDVGAGWTGGLFLQGAGRDFLRLTLWRLRQCVQNNLPGQRPGSNQATSRMLRPSIDAMARAALRRADPQRPESASRVAWPVGGRRRGAARPVVFLLVVDPGRWQVEHSRRKAREGYRPVVPPKTAFAPQSPQRASDSLRHGACIATEWRELPPLLPGASARSCSRQAWRGGVMSLSRYFERGLPAGTIGARRSSATAAVARDFTDAAPHRHSAVLAWQEDTRLFALDQGGFGERESRPSAFASRPCRKPAPTTKWRRCWPVSSSPARRGPASRSPLRQPEHPARSCGRRRICCRERALMRSRRCEGRSPSRNIFRCWRGGGSITTCRAPAVDLWHQTYLLRDFRGGDLDHLAARPRGAGRCR